MNGDTQLVASLVFETVLADLGPDAQQRVIWLMQEYLNGLALGRDRATRVVRFYVPDGDGNAD